MAECCDDLKLRCDVKWRKCIFQIVSHTKERDGNVEHVKTYINMTASSTPHHPSKTRLDAIVLSSKVSDAIQDLLSTKGLSLGGQAHTKWQEAKRASEQASSLGTASRHPIHKTVNGKNDLRHQSSERQRSSYISS